MALPVPIALLALPSLELSPAQMQDWLDDAADMGVQRLADYRLYDDFYDGNHRVRLRDRARRYLEDITGVPFAENFAQPAVDVLAERLEVIGFQSSAATLGETGGVEVTSDPYADLVKAWWEIGRMDGVQGRVHTGALKRGDEFVIVEYDNDRARPVFCRQIPAQCKVVYSEDAPDTVAYAVKVWNTQAVSSRSNPRGSRVTRLNVYWPGRIEKWVRAGDGTEWQHWLDDPAAGETGLPGWPAWWTTTGGMDGAPLGVAMIHFRHLATDAGWGRSRVRMAIPFLAELNKTVADLSDLVDNHALPQDWLAGVAGDVSLEKFAGVWKAPGENAKFGRLEAADTAYLLNAIEGVLSRMARRMRIPLHLLTGGTPPSGEALKTSESGLVGTANACQVDLGNAWEDAMMLGLRLHAAFGDGPEVPDDLRLFTQWESPETRSELSDLQAAEAKKRLGVSGHTLLGELGYDPDKEHERSVVEREEAAELQARVFDAGGLPE